MAMERATNTVTNPGSVSTAGTTPIVPIAAPSPTGQDLVNQMRGRMGYNKGTANVKQSKPMPTAMAKSWRGDANGSLTAAEHAGVSHPSLAPADKKPFGKRK